MNGMTVLLGKKDVKARILEGFFFLYAFFRFFVRNICGFTYVLDDYGEISSRS